MGGVLIDNHHAIVCLRHDVILMQLRAGSTERQVPGLRSLRILLHARGCKVCFVSRKQRCVKFRRWFAEAGGRWPMRRGICVHVWAQR